MIDSFLKTNPICGKSVGLSELFENLKLPETTFKIIKPQKLL